MAAPLCTPQPSGLTDSGVMTPFGCLPFVLRSDGGGAARSMIEILLQWGISLATAAALFALIYAGFQISTAAGDAKKVQAGRELLTASIGGLILIVMGVVILNFLGVRILGLGSLGFSNI